MISVFNFTSSSFMLVLHFEFWKIKYHELMIDTFNNYVKCHYANSHYVECHYAECHYAECHYAVLRLWQKPFVCQVLTFIFLP